MTGLSGSGKTTITKRAVQSLRDKTFRADFLDGDQLRKTICQDLDFSRAGRIDSVIRAAQVAKLLEFHEVYVIISAINPYKTARDFIRKTYGAHIVWIKCSLEAAEERDPKGLYRRARLPSSDRLHIPDFTGISDPYEEPTNADLILDTEELTETEASTKLVDYMMDHIWCP